MISVLIMYAPRIKVFICNFSNTCCTCVVDRCSCDKSKINNSVFSQKTIPCLICKLSAAVGSKIRTNYFLDYISKDFATYLLALECIFLKVKKAYKGPNYYGQITIEFCIINIKSTKRQHYNSFTTFFSLVFFLTCYDISS